jgi:hypothetical protein
MEKMFFSEPQQRVTVGAYGKVLVLLNERKEKPVGDSMGDEMRDAVVPTEQYVYDGCWFDTGGMTSEQALLAAAKASLLSAIEAYDASDSVNAFMLNGQKVWLDKATRVGLMNSTTIAKAMGQATTTLWMGDAKLVVDCDKAIQLLSALEMYALECFNITAAHKKAVTEMTTLEDVLGYDYTGGYPQKLTMEV